MTGLSIVEEQIEVAVVRADARMEGIRRKRSTTLTKLIFRSEKYTLENRDGPPVSPWSRYRRHKPSPRRGSLQSSVEAQVPKYRCP